MQTTKRQNLAVGKKSKLNWNSTSKVTRRPDSDSVLLYWMNELDKYRRKGESSIRKPLL
jgi:hypothetical protein